MKKNKNIYLLFFILMLLFLSNQLLANNKTRVKTLVLSTMNADITKISALVLKEAYGSLGISIKIKILPAERALVSANMGIYDGEVSRIKGVNTKYSNLVLINVPINYVEFIVFTTKKLKINNLESIRPYRIGILRGIKIAEKKTKGMNRILNSSIRIMFSNLIKDHLDLCLVSKVDGLIEKKNGNFKSIHILGEPLFKSGLYHYLHKKNKSLVLAIKKELIKMQKKGRIKRIRNNYIKKILIDIN